MNGASNPLPEGSSISYWGIILVLLILAILGIDELILHRLVYTSFRSQQFVLDGRRADSGWERTVRTLGHGSSNSPWLGWPLSTSKQRIRIQRWPMLSCTGASPRSSALVNRSTTTPSRCHSSQLRKTERLKVSRILVVNRTESVSRNCNSTSLMLSASCARRRRLALAAG